VGVGFEVRSFVDLGDFAVAVDDVGDPFGVAAAFDVVSFGEGTVAVGE
jgi:hypothetical protein